MQVDDFIKAGSGQSAANNSQMHPIRTQRILTRANEERMKKGRGRNGHPMQKKIKNTPHHYTEW